MKTAIVGCGNIAAVHARNLRSLGTELVLAVDEREENAREFAGVWDADRFSTDWRDALAPGIDCVHICVPPALHYPIALACLENGKNVLCEKPLCLSSSEALHLSREAEKRELATAVNFNVRYYPAVREAAERIRGEEFGELILVQGSYLQEFHILPTGYSWRYQPELAGELRAVTEIGSHMIDLITFLTRRRMVRVSALFRNLYPHRKIREGLMHPEGEGTPLEVGSEDLAVISFMLEGGTPGSMVLSEVSHGRVNQVRVEISGTGRNIWWDSEEPGRLMEGQRGTGILENRFPFAGGFPDSFLELARDFYGRVSGQEGDGPDFRTGYENLLVCEALAASSRDDGQWMEIRYEK